MTEKNVKQPVYSVALGAVGAIAGACMGILLFSVILRQGFYAIALPGALIGLGCGRLSGRKSLVLGAACAALALVVGLLTEWYFLPFAKDKSLLFFMSHLHERPGMTLVLILLGASFAFWFGMGREGGSWFRKQPPRED